MKEKPDIFPYDYIREKLKNELYLCKRIEKKYYTRMRCNTCKQPYPGKVLVRKRGAEDTKCLKCFWKETKDLGHNIVVTEDELRKELKNGMD